MLVVPLNDGKQRCKQDDQVPHKLQADGQPPVEREASKGPQCTQLGAQRLYLTNKLNGVEDVS